MRRGRKRKSEILSNDALSDNSIGPVDAHVGSRMCARRRLLQLSQKEMAERLGVTFQQVQKYEKGVNRIGAGRLYNIAQILGVDISYFYEDINVGVYSQLPNEDGSSGLGYFQEDQVEQRFDPMGGTEALVLLKAYYAMPAKARQAMLVMLMNLRSKDENDGQS